MSEQNGLIYPNMMVLSEVIEPENRLLQVPLLKAILFVAVFSEGGVSYGGRNQQYL